MGSVLDPTAHSSYFDEMRSMFRNNHEIAEEDLPNIFLNQFGYLGAAEVAVLRASNETSANLRPANNDASAVPTDPADQRKRELVLVIEMLTVKFVLSPQLISQDILSLTQRWEDYSIEDHRDFLDGRIAAILPEVLVPTKADGTPQSLIGVETIKGTFE